MKEIILKVLSEIACSNTGCCQINLQSKSAQEMIAGKMEKELNITTDNDNNKNTKIEKFIITALSSP